MEIELKKYCDKNDKDLWLYISIFAEWTDRPSRQQRLFDVRYVCEDNVKETWLALKAIPRLVSHAPW